MKRSPYPLSWPDGVPRTRYRTNSDFDKKRGFLTARNGTLDQMRLMGGTSHVVITSNLPINSKGLPYITSAGMLTDPGIAVWWVKKGVEHAIACDRWHTAVENMRAIEKSLEAIRGIARWGTGEMVDRAFAGFAALPPGNGTDAYMAPEQTRAPKTWREIFGVNIEPWLGLPKPDLLAVVKARHRDLIRNAHPDAGGTVEEAIRINAAMQAAELELK